jgi:hypothetical protein
MENPVELLLERYTVQLDCREMNVQLTMGHDVELVMVRSMPIVSAAMPTTVEVEACH